MRTQNTIREVPCAASTFLPPVPCGSLSAAGRMSTWSCQTWARVRARASEKIGLFYYRLLVGLQSGTLHRLNEMCDDLDSEVTERSPSLSYVDDLKKSLYDIAFRLLTRPFGSYYTYNIHYSVRIERNFTIKFPSYIIHCACVQSVSTCRPTPYLDWG